MRRQDGFTLIEAGILIAILALIGIIGVYVWDRQSSRFNLPFVNHETRITGKVLFYNQGPNDAVTGSRPITATLAIGSERDITTWTKGESDHFRLPEETKPIGVKIVKTGEGKLDIRLEKDKNVVCLSSKEYIVDVQAKTYAYSLTDCKIFNTSKRTATADIGLIGFGRSSIKCDPPMCEELQLEH